MIGGCDFIDVEMLIFFIYLGLLIVLFDRFDINDF